MIKEIKNSLLRARVKVMIKGREEYIVKEAVATTTAIRIKTKTS